MFFYPDSGYVLEWIFQEIRLKLLMVDCWAYADVNNHFQPHVDFEKFIVSFRLECLNKYSGTPLNGHPWIKVTSIKRPGTQVPNEQFVQNNPSIKATPIKRFVPQGWRGSTVSAFRILPTLSPNTSYKTLVTGQQQLHCCTELVSLWRPWIIVIGMHF